jgi:hypothetical protein
MMPAEAVSGAVSMGSDPCAQPSRLVDELLARHHVEILVHGTSLLPAGVTARGPSGTRAQRPGEQDD